MIEIKKAENSLMGCDKSDCDCDGERQLFDITGINQYMDYPITLCGLAVIELKGALESIPEKILRS
jgi:hypothetical protein